MALIACRDCGTNVSDRAPTCPKCGAPIAKQQSEGMFLQSLNLGCSVILWGVIAVLTLLVVLSVAGSFGLLD